MFSMLTANQRSRAMTDETAKLKLVLSGDQVERVVAAATAALGAIRDLIAAITVAPVTDRQGDD
jgi:hypothetical protein